MNWKYKKVSIRHSSQFFPLVFFKIMTFQKSEAQIDVFVFLKKNSHNPWCVVLCLTCPDGCVLRMPVRFLITICIVMYYFCSSETPVLTLY